MHTLALGRHLDGHDLVEQLDPALHLRGLGRLIAEAIDEHLDARDLVVLLFLGRAQPLEPRVAFDQVVAVVAVVVGDRAQVQVGDLGDDGVEEEAIVADENDRVRVLAQIALQPVAGVEVQVIGRLVEQQQPRAPQQQLGQRDAHLPAAGEGVGRALVVLL